MIELLLWIYGIGVIVALVITGYFNYSDNETSGEAVFVSILLSLFWPAFLGILVAGFIYGLGAGVSVIRDKMFGEKRE